MGIIFGFLLFFVSILLSFLCKSQVLNITLNDELKAFQTDVEFGDSIDKLIEADKSLELELLMKIPETRI